MSDYNAVAMVDHSPYRAAVQSVAKSALQAKLGEAAGSKRAAEFTLAFQAAAQSNPELFDLPAPAVGRALAMCLLADLTPGGHHPQVWLIPKKIKGTPTLQTWIAPHGYRELARRVGAFIQEIPVWEGGEDCAEEGARLVAEGRVYVPRPTRGERNMGDLIGFYLVVRDQIGARVEWLPADEILKRRKTAAQDHVWKAWGYEMAVKTALKWAFARGLVAMERPEQEALSMETEQEIPQIAPPPSRSQTAADLGLSEPETFDAEEVADSAQEALARWVSASPENAARWNESHPGELPGLASETVAVDFLTRVGA